MQDSTLTCSDALERLPLYVGGDLDTVDRTAVEAHLEGCAECAAQAGAAVRARAVFRAGLGAGSTITTLGSEGSLWPQLRERMLSEGLLAKAPAGRRRSLRLLPTMTKAVPIMAAAAALVFVLRTTDWLGGSDGVGGGQNHAVVTVDEWAPVALPVADLSMGTAPTLGNLRRIGPNETLLSDYATPLQIPSGGGAQPHLPLGGPRESTLAGYR